MRVDISEPIKFKYQLGQIVKTVDPDLICTFRSGEIVETFSLFVFNTLMNGYIVELPFDRVPVIEQNIRLLTIEELEED